MPINTVYHHLERAWQEDLHHFMTDAGNGNHLPLRVLLPPKPKRRLGAVWTTGKINENSPEHLHEKVNPDEIQFAMKSLISWRIPLPVPSSWWVRFFTECLHKLFLRTLGSSSRDQEYSVFPFVCFPLFGGTKWGVKSLGKILFRERVDERWLYSDESWLGDVWGPSIPLP